MLLRACVAAVSAALLLLLAPAIAQADHAFSVSTTEAAAGEEVEFQIFGTQAGESYIVKVEDEEVASGVDSAGNGVTDRFRMPDLGGASRAISVEVRITPLGGLPDHQGYVNPPMRYRVASSGSGGPVPPPPAPVRTVTDPEPVEEPKAAAPPASNDKKNSGKKEKKESGKKPETKTDTGGSDNPSSDTSPQDSPAAAPVASSGGGGDSGSVSSSPSAPAGAAGIETQAPPGPTGPTSSPVGSSLASALSPLSGLAAPGKTGFPILLILLMVLLAALFLTATGPRIWQRYEPELPWGPDVDDEVRLTALSRASASSAELQQTIASRKAARSNGRSNGYNGSAANGAGDHSKTPAAH
jgi:hypothetical protein